LSPWAFLVLLLALTLVGCDDANSSRTTTRENGSPQEKSAELRAKFPQFVKTTESQHAVFSTHPTTGGGGDPVNAGVHGNPVKVNGLPVLLLYEAQELIRNSKLGKMPPHNTDGTVLVEARIHLKRESVRLSTEDGDRREVYSAVIDELIYCEWQ
jgi:hypothetical protein